MGRAHAAHRGPAGRRRRAGGRHDRQRHISCTGHGSRAVAATATVAGQLQQPGPVILCWVLGGGIALCGALTLAELAGALPRSGGIFAYLLESFGPLPAFLFGWTELAVIRAAALGATATIFAEYCGYFVPLTPAQVRRVAAIAIVAIGAMNYIGVRRAAAVMAIATRAQYNPLLAPWLLSLSATTAATPHFATGWGTGVHLSPLAPSLLPVMWSYDGWADP